MITIFIIFAIICILMASKKDKHNKAADAAALAQLPPFQVVAKPMSTASKIINLAVSKSQLLQFFSYSANTVTIQTQDGNWIKSSLGALSVQFVKDKGVVSYFLNSQGRKLKFYSTTNISNNEWDAINYTLCLAGTTYGRDIFSKEAKYAGYINMALKAIKHLT